MQLIKGFLCKAGGLFQGTLKGEVKLTFRQKQNICSCKDWKETKASNKTEGIFTEHVLPTACFTCLDHNKVHCKNLETWTTWSWSQLGKAGLHHFRHLWVSSDTKITPRLLPLFNIRARRGHWNYFWFGVFQLQNIFEHAILHFSEAGHVSGTRDEQLSIIGVEMKIDIMSMHDLPQE